jgi:hypothetical protein
MRAKPFDASQFVATEWSSAADKAAFGNSYLRFVESDWKQSLFTKSFYQRLSNCFGHIAHYCQGQFYETWFTCDKDRLEFLKNTLAWPCWGDPKFTYCDVERAIKQQVRAGNYLGVYELRAAEDLRTTEMTILHRLEAKYRIPAASMPAEVELQGEAAMRPSVASPAAVQEPVQISLF